MPIASIQGYDVVLFVHILAVVVGLGITFGYGVFMGFVQKNAPRSVPAVFRASLVSDRFIVTPGLIIIFLAGFWLMSDRNYDLSESFIGVGILAVIAIFGMVHGFFGPRVRKGIEIAERDLEKGDTLSPEFDAIAKQLALGGQIAGLIIAVTIFFMTVKP